MIEILNIVNRIVFKVPQTEMQAFMDDFKNNISKAGYTMPDDGEICILNGFNTMTMELSGNYFIVLPEATKKEV